MTVYDQTKITGFIQPWHSSRHRMFTHSSGYSYSTLSLVIKVFIKLLKLFYQYLINIYITFMTAETKMDQLEPNFMPG